MVPRPPAPAQVRSAFTLLEVLVATAIVAILFLIGLGLLGSIRQRSENTRCISHLRQVGQALFTYAADHQQQLPPRSMGLYREPGEAKPNGSLRSWIGRLVNLGYVSNPDILYCPSFTPFNNAGATRNVAVGSSAETYGLRTWVPPGHAWGSKIQEEHKSISLIESPADFFIVADSIWLDAGWERQGYGINPGMKSQCVHLRHQGRANALFADGHVEAKPADYFTDLSSANRQRAYSEGRTFYTTDQTEFPE